MDIEDLVKMMRDTLNFVGNQSVENVLSQSEETIEKLFQIIHKLIREIREYLETTAIGKV